MISLSFYHLYDNLFWLLIFFIEIMSCSSIDLESYKTEIISLFQNNNSSAFIASLLQNKYDVKMREHTIKSHLQEWEIHQWNYMTTFNTALHTQIKILFFEIDLEDDDMLHVLQDERFEITFWILKKLWCWLDLWHHTNFIEAQQQTDKIIEAIEKELKKETIEKYEKELLHHHFWNRDFMIS